MTTDEMKEQATLFEVKHKYAIRPKSRPTVGLADNGKTCKDCKYAVRFEQSKSWHKCELNRRRWTGGTGTDIRLKDPACSLFEPDES